MCAPCRHVPDPPWVYRHLPDWRVLSWGRWSYDGRDMWHVAEARGETEPGIEVWEVGYRVNWRANWARRWLKQEQW